MKTTTSKNSDALQKFLNEQRKSVEIPLPQETPLEREPETPVVATETVAKIEVVSEIPVSEIPKVEPEALVEPAPLPESAPEPAAEPAPIVEIQVEPETVSEIPAEPQQTVAEETIPEESIPEEAELEPELPEVEVTPLPPPVPKKTSELLASNRWISHLTRQLIDSEKRLRENGSADQSAPFKSIWNRFRQDAYREQFLGKVEQYSQMYSNGKLQAEISSGNVAKLKQTFLKTIRKVQEPYRSTLFRYYCDEMPISEMIDRLEIPGWVIRERLAGALKQLDQKLEAELGKEKIRNYVLLAQLEKHSS